MSIGQIETPTHVGPWSNGMLMTPAEFDAVADWERGYVYELVHEVLIVTPPPDISERGPNDEIGYWLRSYRDNHPQGSCLDDTAPEQTIRTSSGRRRVDRAIWTGLGRTPRYTQDIPTIAIEFVSASRRDRRRDYIEKREEYAAVGVAEYWVIDRFGRQMTVFRETGELVVAAGDTYTTDLLPGFELPLARLLAFADRGSE